MIRDITIKAVLNGYQASVGCQTLVFNVLEDLLEELKSYLLDPEATEKRYREKAVNAKLLLGNTPTEAPRNPPRSIDEAIRRQASVAGQVAPPSYSAASFTRVAPNDDPYVAQGGGGGVGGPC